MSAVPQPGDSVTFRVGDGHLVPMVGRPGKFYPAAVDITETWTVGHFPRLRTGALVLVPANPVVEGAQDALPQSDEKGAS